ncbi:MAG: AAA family ATPase [Desulfobacteraceae bacterium]|jgi:SpoVK/Ycf46/Vps4 family AAA+-type ATPase
MTGEYYKNSIEHLTAELERIDLLIRNQYQLAKHQFEKKGEFHGLYISEDEVETYLKNPLGLPLWARSEHSLKNYSDYIDLEQAIEKRVLESNKLGIDLRLGRMSQVFGLEHSDVDLLLICLASELNSGYEKIFAYLQDDFTRKKPSVELALNILCTSFQEKMMLRKRLRSGSPLIDQRIIHVDDDPAVQNLPFISRFLHVDERIVAFLFDENILDPQLNNVVRLVKPDKGFEELVLSENIKSSLKAFSENHDQNRSTVLYFYGPYGTGKKSAAEAICLAWEKSLFVADVGRITGPDANDVSLIVRKIIREAVLQNACIYWDHGETLFNEDRKRLLSDFMGSIEASGVLCFLSGTNPWEPRNQFCGGFFVPFEFPLPSYDQRMDLWKRQLTAENMGHDVDPASLAAGFMFSGGQVRDAVQTAKSLSLKKTSDGTKISAHDLRTACLLQSNRKLATLARKITPSCTWDDIVLPPDRLEQLKDIVNHARHKALVFDSWGFGRKLSYGKGLNVLFAGPSGTGKTMSAEIMAADLGLHLYKIDLARVVSKYIGETEKNLSKIFEEAETSNAILFFDEADAIFGKRSEVHDSHDRYANIETSYLLQRMEEYEGITILATNFRRNMDDAFVRRIQYAVEFPFPEKHDRRAIWTKTWPHELPLSDDIDFDFLAGRFEMSGGNIKNICLNAAFIAAANGKTVTMNHLMKATRNEYRKMGKLLMGGEFLELKSASF